MSTPDTLDLPGFEPEEPDGQRPARTRPLNGATDPASAVGRTVPATPLIYVPGATEGTVQWRAEAFQLVNWGGFEGRARFDFHPGATLVTGASGTGKSTLLDAYIALM